MNVASQAMSAASAAISRNVAAKVELFNQLSDQNNHNEPLNASKARKCGKVAQMAQVLAEVSFSRSSSNEKEERKIALANVANQKKHSVAALVAVFQQTKQTVAVQNKASCNTNASKATFAAVIRAHLAKSAAKSQKKAADKEEALERSRVEAAPEHAADRANAVQKRVLELNAAHSKPAAKQRADSEAAFNVAARGTVQLRVQAIDAAQSKRDEESAEAAKPTASSSNAVNRRICDINAAEAEFASKKLPQLAASTAAPRLLSVTKMPLTYNPLVQQHNFQCVFKPILEELFAVLQKRKAKFEFDPEINRLATNEQTIKLSPLKLQASRASSSSKQANEFVASSLAAFEKFNMKKSKSAMLSTSDSLLSVCDGVVNALA